MGRFIERFIDERMIVSVIVINSIAIFLRGFPDVQGGLDVFLFAIDYLCTLYFLIEVSLKIRLFGLGGFLRSGWNWFDFVVVLVSLPTLLAPLIEFGDLSAVLILRLGRLARSFRLLRFIPDGERLWAGAKRGLQASVGVVLALGLYNFVLGLGACYLFGSAAPDYFGDPLMSMYSIFKVFTVEGWFDIPDHIAASSSPFMASLIRAFFVFAVATGGLLGLSLANAVFVDEMVRDNNDALEADVTMLKQEVIALREQNRGEFVALEEKIGRLLDLLEHGDPEHTDPDRVLAAASSVLARGGRPPSADDEG